MSSAYKLCCLVAYVVILVQCCVVCSDDKTSPDTFQTNKYEATNKQYSDVIEAAPQSAPKQSEKISKTEKSEVKNLNGKINDEFNIQSKNEEEKNNNAKKSSPGPGLSNTPNNVQKPNTRSPSLGDILNEILTNIVGGIRNENDGSEPAAPGSAIAKNLIESFNKINDMIKTEIKKYKEELKDIIKENVSEVNADKTNNGAKKQISDPEFNNKPNVVRKPDVGSAAPSRVLEEGLKNVDDKIKNGKDAKTPLAVTELNNKPSVVREPDVVSAAPSKVIVEGLKNVDDKINNDNGKNNQCNSSDNKKYKCWWRTLPQRCLEQIKKTTSKMKREKK